MSSRVLVVATSAASPNSGPTEALYTGSRHASTPPRCWVRCSPMGSGPSRRGRAPIRRPATILIDPPPGCRFQHPLRIRRGRVCRTRRRPLAWPRAVVTAVACRVRMAMAVGRLERRGERIERREGGPVSADAPPVGGDQRTAASPSPVAASRWARRRWRRSRGRGAAEVVARLGEPGSGRSVTLRSHPAPAVPSKQDGASRAASWSTAPTCCS